MPFSTVVDAFLLIFLPTLLQSAVGGLDNGQLRLRITPSPSRAYHARVFCSLPVPDSDLPRIVPLGGGFQGHGHHEVLIRMSDFDQKCNDKRISIDVVEDGDRDTLIVREFWLNTKRFDQAKTVELSMDFSKNSVTVSVSVRYPAYNAFFTVAFYCLRQLKNSEKMDLDSADGADQRSLGDQRSLAGDDQRPPSSSWSLVLFGSAEFPAGDKEGKVQLNNLDQLNSCANSEIVVDLYYKSIIATSKKFRVEEFEEMINDKFMEIQTDI